jgi:hypothetical protein
VIVTVPAATAATMNVALDEPAWMVTIVCTVATAGLLLDREMLVAPADAAAVRLTVPWVLPSVARVVAFSATPAKAGVAAVGTVGEPDPLH